VVSPHGSHWIRPERRLAIYARDRFKCVYCGADLRDAPRDRITLDHIISRAQYRQMRMAENGMHRSDNLITCCTDCNSERQDTPIRDFVQRRSGLCTQAVLDYILRIRRREIA